MRRVFPHYKKDYEMACQVMGAMAEEIVRLRKENAALRTEVEFLETKSKRQGEKIRATLDALTSGK